VIARPGIVSFPVFPVLFLKLCYSLKLSFSLNLLFSAVSKAVVYAVSTFSSVIVHNSLSEGTVGLADVFLISIYV
jgi:hypothetical protein